MYIGTKIVHLKPMTRAEYNTYRGWELPADENGSDEGYLVEYTDGGKSNDKRHAGYISWSPKEQADAAYRHTDGLPFGLAVESLRKGLRVARSGWNGKGMFLFYVDGECWGQSVPGGEDLEQAEYLPWIGMKTATDGIVPWLASQTDILAEDWVILGPT